MEFMGRGSIQNVLDNEQHTLSIRRKLDMARQIAAGMRRIHQHGMIHRDIRPDNILVTLDYTVKIGDMGIARVLDLTGQQTRIGCREFMPPEFFRDSSDGYAICDEKLDIYTYGLTLNQLFTDTVHDFHFNLSSPQITLKKQSPIFYDEIIVKCLDNDPKQRPTALEIEKILELYEQAFNDTMRSKAYTKMNIKEKDRVFMDFYQKHKSHIDHFVKEQFPRQFVQEIPIDFVHKQKQSPMVGEEAFKDPSRIS
jgi:serine/threonine protein kinase